MGGVAAVSGLGRARLEGFTSPELEGLLESAEPPLLVVPLGATEQHGPHLPLGTDTLLAEVLARDLASRRGDCLVAPPLPYGASGEHAGFAGTLSVGAAVLEELVVELVRSAAGFRGVVLVSAHGGNAGPLARAVARLTGEGRRALAWWPRAADLVGAGLGRVDAHAGFLETSLVLALAPEEVRTGCARAGAREPLAALWPRLRRDGVAAVAPNGVLGDPEGASADAGASARRALVSALDAAVDAFSRGAGATAAGEGEDG